MRMIHLRSILKAAVFASSVVGAVLIAAIGTADAATTYFLCTPQQVGTFTDRVHVRCVPPAETTISYFAVCSSTNAAFAARALSIFTTAKVTGKQVAIYYNSADTSGTACGCSTNDCRVISGAEVMP